MNDDLVQRLLFAESDFLDALQSGPQMLASYRESLSALPNALSTATKTGGAGNETLSLAHTVASRILNLANCFLDIKREEELSTLQLQSDCAAMFRQMDALDLNAQPKSSPADARTSTPNMGSSSPFLASAHQWLVDNLHNPYPTAEVKARIAAASSCQVSSVNSWFTNARRRIGWTNLCREHFSNRRVDMLDAAYRALVEEDPQRVLSLGLSHSFVTMKVAAEGLFSSTFTTSAFAEDLDAIVKDVTEEDRGSIRAGKYSQVDQTSPTKVRGSEIRRGSLLTERENLQGVRDAYPSPDLSITVSPVSALDDSFTDESEEGEDVAPPIIAGSKRRRSSVESVDQPSSITSRPIKRLRASMTSRACLPSPPSSIDGIDEASDHSSPDLSPAHSTLPETNKALPSRKRHLSEPDTTGIAKRPRDSMATPRLHTVSDLLPHSNMENEHSIDDWFNTNFDALFAIPPPVDATEPDFSASWEVELFNDYSIPGNPKYAPKGLPAPTVDTHISAQTDLLDLDNLLQSIGGDTFVTPSDNGPPADVTGAPYMPSLGSPIPDISQTNIDWMSLLNDQDPYQPTICSTFPQYLSDFQPLSEIDLSMIQLPHVMPIVNSQSDFASKQAKLDQFNAMQEAVRKMQQELQSEGILI